MKCNCNTDMETLFRHYDGVELHYCDNCKNYMMVKNNKPIHVSGGSYVYQLNRSSFSNLGTFIPLPCQTFEYRKEEKHHQKEDWEKDIETFIKDTNQKATDHKETKRRKHNEKKGGIEKDRT